MCDIYSIVVVEGGVNPEYFLDRMKQYELDAIIKGIENKSKPSWEQARMIMYMVAQCNSTKNLKPTDIMKFTWDEEKKEETDWSEIRAAKETLKQLKQQQNKQ